MTKLDQVRDRYLHDAIFRTYVDLMRKCIVDLDLTPGELRDAAMLAAIIEDERKPMDPIYIDPACPPMSGRPYR